MIEAPDNAYLAGLVQELLKLPRETEWLELKHNNSDPDEIGEYISALANSAALNGKATGFLLWGIEDGTHAVLGTTFSPHAVRKGNEPLETWLLRLLTPKIHFRFHEIYMDGVQVTLLEIDRAFRHPVRFKTDEYVRIGDVKKPLREAPDRERELWRILDMTPFEQLLAAERSTGADVLTKLDHQAYFDLLKQPIPLDGEAILDVLKKDGLITPNQAGGWDILNLGAVLFARHLPDFARLKRKVPRVIQYKGNDRSETIMEKEGQLGYANGFKGLIAYINARLPSNEVIGQALRKSVPMYPELAIRELVANMLIHQDMFAPGSGPMVEIFSDRIEITNPGKPLVEPDRFMDSPPKSRNELMASLMRRLGICEERGSGIDKVAGQVELFQLPAPIFEDPEGFTRIVLFAHRPLVEMEKADRVRACYLHACLRYVTRQHMTNSSVRQRFGIEEKNAATASRLLKEAVEAGSIAPYDPKAANKLMRYVPYWAAPKYRDFL